MRGVDQATEHRLKGPKVSVPYFECRVDDDPLLGTIFARAATKKLAVRTAAIAALQVAIYNKTSFL